MGYIKCKSCDHLYCTCQGIKCPSCGTRPAPDPNSASRVSKLPFIAMHLAKQESAERGAEPLPSPRPVEQEAV